MKLPGLTFDYRKSQVFRHPKAAFREVGDDIFLVHPDGEQIYNLNPMAAALWRLLEHPMSGADMAEVVQAAFPVMAPDKIENDIKAALNDFIQRGFAQVKS